MKELMMDITRENYESWFVDYLEGNLDEKLVDRFIEFLQENPDLKEELKLFESVSAVPEELTFKPKNKLYKAKYDLETEFNDAAIAELEGDLDNEEKASFEKYLAAHPEKQKDRQLFEKTIIRPDEAIRFEKKDKLYKKQGRKVILHWAGRVAAILILALAIFSLINRNSNTPELNNQLVRGEEKTDQKIETPAESMEKSEIPVREENQVEKEPAESINDTNIKAPTANIEKLMAANKISVVQEEIVPERIPLEVPKAMNPLTASIEVPVQHAQMGVMTLVYPNDVIVDEHLLTDNLRGKVSLQKITRAGLNLVASLSNERFNYETNAEGKVTEYNYESRLLAFSIPASHPTDGE